jgi:hypothetical protein
MMMPRPLSSVCRTVGLFTTASAADDGWWLVESRAEDAAAGSSLDARRLWNSAGKPAALSSQLVSIF